MGLWHVPEKILLPAEPGRVSTFEFNGRLPNGDQVMAYAQAQYDLLSPSSPPFPRGHTAVLFRFDADGTLKSVEFESTGHDPQDPDRSYRKSRELLAKLVRPLQAEGWVSADILVRPFFVRVDGLATGLIYRTAGEDEGEESEYSEEEVRLVPFDKIFHRPWTDGNYDT
jgi:hypothetical protein